MVNAAWFVGGRVMAAALVLVLAGCEVPPAQYMQSRPQSIVASTQQWGDIAATAVTQLVPALPSIHPRVYLPRPEAGDFSRVFTAQVMTELVKHGVVVSGNPREAYTVRITATVVDHNHIPTPPLATAVAALGISTVVPLPAPRLSEVVITATLSARNAVVAASTGSFYVDFFDSDEYRNYPRSDEDTSRAQLAVSPQWRPLVAQ